MFAWVNLESCVLFDMRDILEVGLTWLYPWRTWAMMALMVKNSPANAGDLRDTGLIPGSWRSSGGGHGNPLEYSCLENLMDRGAWWATVHGVAKCQTWLKQLSTHTCITVGMFAWVNLGSHIPFDTRDILEVGLAWLYPWRVWVITQGTQCLPSPPQPGSWICWRKHKLLKNVWQKATFERKTPFYWRMDTYNSPICWKF